MVVTETNDLSSTILERTLPFLDIDLAVTEETLPSLMICCCGSSSPLWLIQQRTVVENITGDFPVTSAISENLNPAVKRKYGEI